jgi:hypothetical protein
MYCWHYWSKQNKTQGEQVQVAQRNAHRHCGCIADLEIGEEDAHAYTSSEHFMAEVVKKRKIRKWVSHNRILRFPIIFHNRVASQPPHGIMLIRHPAQGQHSYPPQPDARLRELSGIDLRLPALRLPLYFSAFSTPQRLAADWTPALITSPLAPLRLWNLVVMGAGSLLHWVNPEIPANI